jgi:hypothetical protein
MTIKFSYVVEVIKNIGHIAILTPITKVSFDKKMVTPIEVSLIYHCRTFAILDKKKPCRFVETSLLADGYTTALM